MSRVQPNPASGTVIPAALLFLAAILAATPVVASATVSEPSATQRSEVATPGEALLDQGNALALQGKFREAKDHFARAARVQRAAGVLPTLAMTRLAQMHHGDGDVGQAAYVLSNLARLAEQMGDPVVQARALLEATLLYHSMGRYEETARGAQRLEKLRTSPYISADMRAEIERRLDLV